MRFFNNFQGPGISYGENPLIGFKAIGSDIFQKTVSNLFGDKDDLGLAATYGVMQGQFAIIDIFNTQSQHNILQRVLD
jgi:hypothetical protein